MHGAVARWADDEAARPCRCQGLPIKLKLTAGQVDKSADDMLDDLADAQILLADRADTATRRVCGWKAVGWG